MVIKISRSSYCSSLIKAKELESPAVCSLLFGGVRCTEVFIVILYHWELEKEPVARCLEVSAVQRLFTENNNENIPFSTLVSVVWRRTRCRGVRY